MRGLFYTVKTLHESRISLLIQRLGEGIGYVNQFLLKITQEGRHPVDTPRAGIVGAATGIQAAVAQRAEAAFRRGITPGCNIVCLPGTVYAVVHITKSYLRSITHPDHA